MMDPDEREEALEEAGLDPDDYDFFQVILKIVLCKGKEMLTW